MNSKHLSVIAVAALAAVLVASATMASTDYAFAGKKHYGKSQASSQVTSCGNGDISVADFCQDIDAQNQGKENSAAQTSNQVLNLDIDVDPRIIK